MTVIELLNNLIADMTDSINDYKGDIRRTDSRLKIQDRNTRINELKGWCVVLKTLLNENIDTTGVFIPFSIGQTVYIVNERIEKVNEEHYIERYDHLGAVDGVRTIYGRYYEVEEREFTLRLLGKYDLEEIFVNRIDAERHRIELNYKYGGQFSIGC